MIVFNGMDVAGVIILGLMFLICLEVAIITRIISQKEGDHDKD